MNNLTMCFVQVLEHLLAMQSSTKNDEKARVGNAPPERAPEHDAPKNIPENIPEKFVAALKGEAVAWSEKSLTDTFLNAASHAIEKELRNAPHATVANLISLAECIASAALKTDSTVFSERDLQKHLWNVFSYEAHSLCLDDILIASDKEDAALPAIGALRDTRKVRITDSNAQPPNIKPPNIPLGDVARELIFTSNILLTLPKEEDIENLPLGEESKKKMRSICKIEKQRYWYDHPIPFGVPRKSDELLYGLRGLSDALKFEKERGTVSDDAMLTVVLSVSVTHTSLGSIACEYLQAHIAEECFEGLAVYVFTEDDALHISENLEVIAGKNSGITEVFGVDGRYGRHYSFLKAIAAVWNVCVDDAVRATFKIDLDQIFPQETLVKETGKSAFEHLATGLWGADGMDADGNAVHLGMIAGALVNEADIHKGLFTPDVNFPHGDTLSVEELFFPRVPLMAVSTRAELMTRYGVTSDADVDGESECLQRVHVTGGTNGILVDALRTYRPFTPSFIGRAEDQAYILSVHGMKGKPRLCYVHAAGLIMRHDKAAFASEAIHAAKHGTFVGDLLRTLLFSYYAQALPGKLEYAKRYFAPFTSCFMSDIPVCFVMGRLILSIAKLISQGKETDAQAQLELASRELVKELNEDSATRIATQYEYERKAWNAFYDALEIMADDESVYGPQCNNIKKRVSACRIL